MTRISHIIDIEEDFTNSMAHDQATIKSSRLHSSCGVWRSFCRHLCVCLLQVLLSAPHVPSWQCLAVFYASVGCARLEIEQI